MTTQTITHSKAAFTSAAQVQPMVMSIQNVSKQSNNKHWGLRDFTLELGPGVLGLLGLNGAGKSTLMRHPGDHSKGYIRYNHMERGGHRQIARRTARRVGISAAGFRCVPESVRD